VDFWGYRWGYFEHEKHEKIKCFNALGALYISLLRYQTFLSFQRKPVDLGAMFGDPAPQESHRKAGDHGRGASS
jgi:hypothetical protein